MAYCLYPNCPNQAQMGEDYCFDHPLGGKPIVYMRNPSPTVERGDEPSPVGDPPDHSGDFDV